MDAAFCDCEERSEADDRLEAVKRITSSPANLTETDGDAPTGNGGEDTDEGTEIRVDDEASSGSEDDPETDDPMEPIETVTLAPLGLSGGVVTRSKLRADRTGGVVVLETIRLIGRPDQIAYFQARPVYVETPMPCHASRSRDMGDAHVST